MVRKKSSSRLVSIALAILVFPVTAILAACVCFGLVVIVYSLVPVSVINSSFHQNLIFVVLTTIPFLAAVLVSRGIYLAMRWEIVDSEFGYCSRCGYDLTGNVSGVCPECGTGIHEK